MIICFLFLFKYIENEKVIKIPFHTIYNETELNINNIMVNIYKSKIGTEIEIGNSLIKCNLSFFTQSYNTFLLGEGSNIKIKPLFNKSKSNSYKIISKNKTFYYEHFSSGEYGEDNLKIKEINLKKTYFILTNVITDNYKDEIITPLSIGLKLRNAHNQQNLENMTFLYQLQQKEKLSNQIFYFKFLNDREGEFIIGENPYLNNNFVYTRTGKFYYGSQGLDWGFNFDKIYYGDKEINSEYDGIFSIEQFFIIATDNFFNDIKNYFFDNHKTCYLNISSFESFKKLKFFICEKNTNISDFKTIKFYIKYNNFTFEFNHKDLFFEYNDKLFFGIVNIKTARKEIVLGRIFLKKYLLYFDNNKKVIGFLNSNNQKGFNEILYLVFVIVIILIIILSLYIYLNIKKKRKKRLNELDDNYDYLEKI